jgi:tRNA threonylcarbamoyladenosine biosynthesis protein TsaE
VPDDTVHGTTDGEPVVPIPPLADRGGLSLNRDALVAWGEAFGRAARAPLVVALSGELGAGKTTLAQAICRGYGVRGEVTSPTYAIVQEYEAERTPVFHLDLYRLRGPEELANLGWDDLLAADALVLIEWPERAGAYLPAHVPIRLAHDAMHADHRLLLAG